MKAKVKQGLTTGDVSNILGGAISQATVIRYFDKGVLTGWRHPVMGWRVIDPKSVKALPKKQGLTTGEVSKILGISARRVIRFSERGLLRGSKNPITGRIVIDLESVDALAKEGMKAWPRRGRPRKPSGSSNEAEVIPVTKKEG